jgi:hypothetical protein
LTWVNQFYVADAIFLDISFVDLNDGWVVGQGGIWITSNGGSTWIKKYGDSTTHLGGVCFVDSSRGWAVGKITSPARSLILTTSNGGNTWVEQTSDVGADLRDVFFVDLSRGWAVGWPYAASKGTILSYNLLSNVPPNIPMNPLCEGQTNPQGIPSLEPIFSWTFDDPNAEDTQGAWQIQVSTEANGGGTMMWDSGKVAGSDSSVTYGDLPLSWGATYHLRVKTWDNYDAEGPYCVDQTFETISIMIVDIDVKPRNEHNKINLKSKSLLSVVILGSSSLDTSTIDPESINIEGVSIATRGSAKNPKPAFTFRDVNSDTHMDLVVKFEIQALVDAGVLTSTTNTLTVNGKLYDNTPIEGSDSANIVP